MHTCFSRTGAQHLCTAAAAGVTATCARTLDDECIGEWSAKQGWECAATFTCVDETVCTTVAPAERDAGSTRAQQGESV